MTVSASVVVITFNSRKDIGPCLDSICKNEAHAVVVDNGSTDGTLEFLAGSYPTVPVVKNLENGYARAANIGFRNTHSSVVIVSNADVSYPDNSLKTLVNYLEASPKVGIVGPQQIYSDGSWQRSWGVTPGIVEALLELVGITSLRGLCRRVLWPRRLSRRPRNVGYVDGAVMAIRRRTWEDVQRFDESFRFYAEEADFCIRARNAGWRIVALPLAIVVHRRGASSTLANMNTDSHVQAMLTALRQLIAKHHTAPYVSCYFLVKRAFHILQSVVCRILCAAPTGSWGSVLRRKHQIHRSYVRQLGFQKAHQTTGRSVEQA